MIQAHFALNAHLGRPPMDAIIWRCMAPWKVKDLIERHALRFSRLDEMEDKYEGQVPKANLIPSID